MPPENHPHSDSLASVASDGTEPFSILPDLYRASAEATFETADGVDLGTVVAALPVPNGLDDRYPAWHSSYSFDAILRAVVLKYTLGMDSDADLQRRLRTDPFLLGQLDFNDVPNQSTFWRTWNRRFTPELREAVLDAANAIAEVAREHDIDAPGPTRDSSDENENRRDGRLGKPSPVVGEADRVAKATRREVFPALSLERASNATIPESAFWSLQTYCDLRENLHANAGAELFAHESRGVTPLGHNHRDQLRGQSVEQYREMLRSAVSNIVTTAKRDGVLDRKESVAIDITTSTRFYGDRNGHEEIIMGTKEPNDEYAYHWATIQIVNSECPVVLDARPVRRGESRAEVVADLLDSALQHVAVDLVLADREFDSDDVKSACEARGLRYLIPKRKHTSEKTTEKRLSRAGRESKVEVQQTIRGPDRKKLYLRREDRDDGGVAVGATPYEREYRQTLWDELGETVGIDVGTDEREDAAFHYLGTDILGDEKPENDEYDRYIVFETNCELPVDAGRDELRKAVECVTRQYRKRWTIENGYKSLKSFIVPTTSKSHALRFFNFVFAVLLYNVWKLVDLLLRQLFGIKDGRPVLSAAQVLASVQRATGVG